MLKTAINVLVIYGLIVTVMYLAQRRLQYLPGREFADAAAIGLTGVEQLSLKTDDGETIVAWFTKPTATKPVIDTTPNGS